MSGDLHRHDAYSKHDLKDSYRQEKHRGLTALLKRPIRIYPINELHDTIHNSHVDEVHYGKLPGLVPSGYHGPFPLSRHASSRNDHDSMGLAFVPDNARDALSEGFSLPQPLFVVALIARLPRYRVTIGMASDPLRETLLSDSLFRPPIAS
jgi:hypothetical protein